MLRQELTKRTLKTAVTKIPLQVVHTIARSFLLKYRWTSLWLFKGFLMPSKMGSYIENPIHHFCKLWEISTLLTPVYSGIVISVICAALLSLKQMSLHLQSNKNGQPLSCQSWTLDQQGQNSWKSNCDSKLKEHSTRRYFRCNCLPFLVDTAVTAAHLNRLNWHHLEALRLFDWCYDCHVLLWAACKPAEWCHE